jgi:phosphate butyryltransferase
MPLAGFDQLCRDADARGRPATVAVAGAADRTVLDALRAAGDRGWVSPILFGQEEEIRGAAEEAGVDLQGFTLLEAEDPAGAAVVAVRSGRAQMLMKGRIATPDLMRAVLDPESGLRAGRAICQVVLMEIARDARRFLMADTGVMIRPDLAKKIDVMAGAVELARAIGSDRPRVAIMAASEKVVSSMPETLHAAELRRRNRGGEFPDCAIEGPLSFDLAYAVDAAEKKRVGGEVAGAAEVMIFPDLASANLTVKAIMYTADCRFGGVLRGTTHPVVFMSRADTAATRLNSLALALKLVPPG